MYVYALMLFLMSSHNHKEFIIRQYVQFDNEVYIILSYLKSWI